VGDIKVAEAAVELSMDDTEWLRHEIEAIGKNYQDISGRLRLLEIQQAVNTTRLSIYAGISGGISGGTIAIVMQFLQHIL
jgi:hypothetical protein